MAALVAGVHGQGVNSGVQRAKRGLSPTGGRRVRSEPASRLERFLWSREMRDRHAGSSVITIIVVVIQ